MKKKKITYIYILFLFYSFDGILAQEIKLNITSKDSLENSILRKIDFKESHHTISNIKKEITNILDTISKYGYLTATSKKIFCNDSIYTESFSLGPKIKVAVLVQNKKKKIICFGNLEKHIKKLNDSLEVNGEAFSEIKLNEISVKKDTLFAFVNIKKSSRRSINKITVSGYKNFPKGFLKYYFKTKSTFNQQQIEELSRLTKDLPFAKETRPPETLFTKDSTNIYLYLKRRKTNSIDGLLNFGTDKETNKFQVNGYIDLKLLNSFNTGETINLYWSKIEKERSELQLKTELPYVANSRFNFKLYLDFYRQDSTFINTDFNTGISYQINPRTSIGLNYNSLQSNSNSELAEELKNTFLGISINYNQFNKYTPFSKGFLFDLNIYIGERNTNETYNKQTKLKSNFIYSFEINKKNYLSLKNQWGILWSKNYFTNELFRIGGVNTIRGVDQQSIFTEKYTFINTEYKLKTNTESFLFLFSDLGWYEKSGINNILSLGVGYSFKIKNNLISFTYSTSNQEKTKLFESSMLFFTVLNYF